jgi:hypothetical protein
MTRFAFISPLALAACGPAVPTAEDLIPEYLGIQTTLLDVGLVQFNVAMTKALSADDVRNYADCAAAGYTLARGYSFARHLRTNVYNEGGIWSADAVYTISPTLPDGPVKMDVEVTAAACEESGIPMV